MKPSLTAFLLKVIAPAAFIMAAGCSEDSGGSSGGGSRRPANPIEDTPIGGAPETTGFWVNLRSTSFSSLVNSSTGFGQPCFIGVEAAETDMTCFIDLLEGDLYMYDMNLQYNVPPQLCAHVRTSIPWHWNYSSGIGPSAVNIRYFEDGTIDTCTAFSDATGALVPCTGGGGHPEVTIADNDVACIYNYTQVDPTLPNCCFGSYTKTVAREDSGGGPDQVAVTTPVWGEPNAVGACLGGPILASSNWDVFSRAGYPARRIQAIGKIDPDNAGLNDAITLEANATDLQVGFSYTSNFFTTTGTPHTHTGYGGVGSSTRPYALDPINDLDRSPFNATVRGATLLHGQEAYEFECLDEAFEIKHRIRAYIREWNTLAAYLAYEESEGVVYDPDVDGDEGVDCDFTGIGDSPCNDRGDLDDLIYSNGGVYDTTTPDAATRAGFFPNAN